MNQFHLNNSSDICRICLERKNDMFSIYDKYSDEYNEPIFCMIMYCASVKIEKGDGLPDLLCNYCKTRLETAYLFKRDCEQSENKLRQNLKIDYNKCKTENNLEIQNHTDNFSNNGNVKLEIDVESETFHYGNNDSESEDPLYPNMYVMTEMRQSKSPEITTHESLDCTRGEFPCTFCCKKFDLKSNLLAHVWAMHNSNTNKNSTSIHTTIDLKQEVKSPQPEVSDDDSFSNNESNQENDDEEEQDDDDDDDAEFDPKSEELVPTTRYSKRRKTSARIKSKVAPKIRRFVCYVCSNTFYTENEYMAHVTENHSNQRYVCDFETCDQEFSEYLKYALHRKDDHLIENYLSCQECQRGYSNKRSLDRHIFNKHGDRPHACEHCSKRFRESKALEKHMIVHSKEYKCEFCNKIFSTSFRLTNHKRIHTNEKTHSCDECGKKFNKKSNLERHIDVHYPKGKCKEKSRHSRKEKNHLCPYCGQTFGRPVDLTTHIRIHTGVKPFSCDNCEYRCHDKQLLRSHIRIHTGDRPYKCSYCEKAFGTRGYLTIHERFHSGHRPYICPTCKKGFTNSKDLKVHERTHTGIKLFSCQICNNSFTTLHYLRVHTKKHETT